MVIRGPAALGAALVDLVVPRGCAGCGRPGPAVCARCRAALTDGRSLLVAAPGPVGLPACAATALYDGVVRDLVIAFKERSRPDLAGLLGAALAGAVTAAIGGTGTAAGPAIADRRAGPLVLVPVPARAAARAARGYDHGSLLARSAAGALRRAGVAAAVGPVLRVAGRSVDQVGLGPAARAANVAGTFAARSRALPAGRRFVLVDDVLTTGATMREAAATLLAAGVRVEAAAVVAAVAASGSGRPARGPPGADYT